jgi:hypothetical protein
VRSLVADAAACVHPLIARVSIAVHKPYNDLTLVGVARMQYAKADEPKNPTASVRQSQRRLFGKYDIKNKAGSLVQFQAAAGCTLARNTAHVQEAKHFEHTCHEAQVMARMIKGASGRKGRGGDGGEGYSKNQVSLAFAIMSLYVEPNMAVRMLTSEMDTRIEYEMNKKMITP